ncbi:MAG: DUF11 domain-containing protein, partial [Halanaerobiales bacterium]|nr:DUF11 domain-containing protein [Halanaerobiales bacterium]
MEGKTGRFLLMLLLILISFSVSVDAIGPYLEITQTVPTAYINDTGGQDVKATFKNTGTEIAENVTVDIDLPNGGFSYKIGSLTAKFKNDVGDPGTVLTANVVDGDPFQITFDPQLDMAIGQILELTYKIATDATVTVGTHYVLSVTGNYVGSNDIDEELLEVITGAISCSFTPISPLPFEAERGEQITLEAKVENTGVGNLYGVLLETNWDIGFDSAEIVALDSNITPSLVGSSYQITLGEILSGESKYFRFNLMVADYESFALNMQLTNPGGDNFSDSIIFNLLVEQPNIAINPSNVTIDYGTPGKMNIQITNENVSAYTGSAREFKLNTNIDSTFNVTNLTIGWNYSNGVFTYTANGGVIGVDETVNLSFDLDPKNRYITNSGTISIYSDYKNDIEQSFAYPLAFATYSFINVPTINLTQTINSEATDGDDLRVFLAEQVEFQFKPTLTHVDKWKEGQDIVFTETFAVDFDVNNVIVTHGNLNWVGNAITWTLTRDQVALNPVMTVDTQFTSDADRSGRFIGNTARVDGTTVWDCNLADWVTTNFYLQSRNEEAAFLIESKYIDNLPTEGYYDVCGKDDKDVIQYRLEYNFDPISGGTWTGSTLTDELDQSQEFVPGSAQYRIDSGSWKDVPAINIISTTPLTIDLGFLKDAEFGGIDFVDGANVSFRYQLSLTNASLALGSNNVRFISRTDLRIANAIGGAGVNEDHFYQAVFVPISRALMNIGIYLNTEQVSIGQRLRATVDVAKLTPWDNNNLVVTVSTNGSYEYVGNPTYTGFGGQIPNVVLTAANPDEITFTFTNPLEVNQGGTISFDLDKTVDNNHRIDAQLDFDDDLGEHFTDTAYDIPAYQLKGVLSIIVNPDPIKITQDSMSWDINVSNIGGGVAFNVELHDFLKNVMVFDSSTVDSAPVVPNIADDGDFKDISWDLGDIPVGGSKIINMVVHTSGISTDFNGANNLSATTAWVDRDGTFHAYDTATLNNAPKFITMNSYTFLKNSADSAITLCDSGIVKLLVKNSGYTNNYNLILTQSLGQTGFQYIPGTAKIVGGLDINDPVVSGTNLIWTFDISSPDSNYLAELVEMAPGDEFEIQFAVQSGEDFNAFQKIQPSATWQTPEETGGVLRGGISTGAEFRVPINQPKITVIVKGKNITQGDSSYVDNVIASLNDRIEWKIEITNSGDATATNVILENTLPTNMSFVSVTGPGLNSVVPAVSWNIDDIPITTHEYIIEADFSGPCGPNKLNTASVRWGAAGSSSLTTPIDNEDTATLITEPALNVLAQMIPDFTTKDGRVTITIINTGAPLYNVTLTDDITNRFVVDSDSISYSAELVGPTVEPNKGDVGNVLTWQWAGPIPAGTHTISFDIRDNSATDGASDGSIVNTSLNLTYENSSSVAKAPVSSTPSFDPKKANLIITKNPSVQVANDGEVVTWTIRVTNIGETDATNVEIVDILGDGTVDNGFIYYPIGTSPAPDTALGNTLTWSNLTIGQSDFYEITLNAITKAGGKHTSKVTATEYNVDKSKSVCEDTRTAAVAVFDFDVTIDTDTGDVNDPDVDSFGEIARFTITMNFDGDDTYQNIQVINTLPEGLEYLGSFGGIELCDSVIVNGKTATFDLLGFTGTKTKNIIFDVRILDEAALGRGDVLTNDAKMSFDIDFGGGFTASFPNTLSNLQDQNSFTLKEPDVSLNSRTTNPADGSKVSAGQEIIHTLRFQNSNLANVSPGHGIKVEETIPVGERDFDPLSEGFSILKGGVTPLVADIDYAATYTSGTGKLTIVFKNTALGILQKNEYFDIEYKTKVDSSIAADVTLQHSAQLIEYYGQPVGTTGVKTYTDPNPPETVSYSTVKSDFDVNVTIPGDKKVVPGDTVSYEITLTVPKGTSVYDINLVNQLPAGIEYVNGSSSAADIGNPAPTITGNTTTGQIITWYAESDNYDIANNTGSDITYTINFDAVVLDDVTINRGDILTNLFLYNYNTIDNNSLTRTNNSAVSDTVTVKEPELTVSAEEISTGPYEAGDTVTYKITVEHSLASNATAYDVKITDILPLLGVDYTAYTANPDNPGVATEVGQNISFGNDGSIDIAEGNSFIFNLTATLNETVEADQVLSNNVNIEWSSKDGVNANERTDTASLAGTVDITVNDSTAFTIARLGDPKFVIGETIDYRMVVTINKGTTTAFKVKNVLPNGIEYISSTISPDGTGDIGFTLVSKPSVGATGELVWDFGTIVNSGNSTTITIDFTTKILNIVENQANVPANNFSYASYINGEGDSNNTLTKMDSFTIKEPQLAISKTFNNGSYDAKDTVTYTIKVWHNSTVAPYDVSAYDVAISDILPEGMTYVAGSISSGGTYNAGTLSWNIPEIDITKNVGDPIILTYEVTLNDTVEPGDVFDENVNVTWTSLSGVVAGEREGTGGLNDYTVTDSSALTSADNTDLTWSPLGITNYAVGETVTFQLKLSLTEGITKGVIIRDTLPAGMKFDSVNYQNGNLGIVPNQTNQPFEGDTGELVWQFSSIDNPGNADILDDYITIEYTAVVQDVLENIRGKVLTSTAKVEYTNGQSIVKNILNVDQYVTVIEPELKIETALTSVGPYEAGDTVTYQVTISHTADSNATAYDVEITDTLPDEITYVSYAANPNDPGAPVISGQNIAWGENGAIDINDGDTFIFNINVTLDDEAKPGQILSNDLEVKYSS